MFQIVICYPKHFILMETSVLDCSSVPTDLTLNVGGRDFFVHRLVLIMRSPYFNKMLTGSFKEKDMNVISLPDIDLDIFTQFLNLIYGRSYESSPALMAVVNMYGVAGVTIDKLHKEFGVSEDQFEEYIEACIELYSMPLPQKVIDMIASKITSMEYLTVLISITKISQDLKEDILGSRKMHYYGDIQRVEKLLKEAKEEKATGKKSIHLSLDDEMDVRIAVMAYGESDALLKLRGNTRAQKYEIIKGLQKKYDDGITQDKLTAIRKSLTRTDIFNGIRTLPNLQRGRYVFSNESHGRKKYHIFAARPSITDPESDVFDYYDRLIGLFGTFSDYFSNMIPQLYYSNIIGSQTINSDIRPPIHETKQLDIEPTGIPDIYKETTRGFTFLVYESGMFCFGRYDDEGLHSLTNDEAVYVVREYKIRVLGPFLPFLPFEPLHDSFSIIDTEGTRTTIMVGKGSNIAFNKQGDYLGVYDKTTQKIVPASIELLQCPNVWRPVNSDPEQ